MIQRIQTVYLFLSGVVMSFLVFNHMVSIESSDRSAELWLSGIKDSGTGDYLIQSWPLMALAVIIIFLYLITILMYKKRELQMRLVVYVIILVFSFVGVGAFYVIQGANMMDGKITMEYFSVMPGVAVILSILAWRGIRRDYLMLKAVDRIR
ncbi:MAG: DUF4293 domain-containing protein [Bacteroidota bacterium]|nr:DUF4293 domain-containing protein [Bacteroidota bacterium]